MKAGSLTTENKETIMTMNQCKDWIMTKKIALLKHPLDNRGSMYVLLYNFKTQSMHFIIEIN